MRIILKSLVQAIFFALCVVNVTYASEANEKTIDPRLIEIVETIKQRLSTQGNVTEKNPFFQITTDLITSPYDVDPDAIRVAAEKFKAQPVFDHDIDTQLIADMFLEYSNEVENYLDGEGTKNIALEYLDSEHWFEKFMAYRLSATYFSDHNENQRALNHAQKALSVIPVTESELSKFARIEAININAYFYNVLGNIEFAIVSSLEYLSLSENQIDKQADIDLINNLIFSHRLWRETASQEYLALSLIEFAGKVDSAVPGLFEFRTAQSKNDIGQYGDGLEFSRKAQEKANIELLVTQAKVSEAIALIGLNRLDEADKILETLQIDLSTNTLLHMTKDESLLYLGYLRAVKSGDQELAISLYNRRVDVLSRKYLSESSRETNSMLAALENTRARQEERALAAKREAELQAITIQKQRTLNRALMGLLAFLLVAVTALLAFMKYRGKTLKILAQKEKEAASADKLKSEFLGVMSHELRTPLNGIIGFADFLNQTHADPDVRKKTGVILDSGQDLLDVVEAMTDMGRIEAGKMDIFEDEVDIAELIAPLIEANRAKAEEKNVKFTAFIDPAIDIHMVDGMRFKQCIKTLLDNAISFTNKGRVHLHITAHGERAAGVDELQVVVADTGVGMSELVQSRLFTPFMQADTSLKRAHMGTGLSLAIAKALAELMGGSISVISRAARGSEFTLKVPVTTPKALPEIEAVVEEAVTIDDAPLELTHSEALTDADLIDFDQIIEKQGETDIDLPAPIIDLMKPRSNNRPASLHLPPETKAAQASHNRQGLRVLLVDDLSTNRNFVRDLLRDMECDCLDAEDGYQAIEVLRSSPVDVVLMDVHMNRMDGIEATRRIRSLDTDFANIPIIMLTADNSVEISSKSLAAGANVFLTKPVLLEELVSAFDYVLKTPKALQL